MPARGMPLGRSGAARRVTARLAGSRAVYAAARVVVDARSGGVCEICCYRPATEHQHRVRRGMGGSSRNPAIHRPSSLLHLCRSCHYDADHHSDRHAFGWSVRRAEDPAAVPVLLGGQWVLLDDSGGQEPKPYRGEDR